MAHKVTCWNTEVAAAGESAAAPAAKALLARSQTSSPMDLAAPP